MQAGYLTDEELEALPRVTTETGSTISDAVTGRICRDLLHMSLYLAQFAQGIRLHGHVFADRPTRWNREKRKVSGFYDKFYNPRQSAHYLHNLTTILKDDKDIDELG